MMKSQEDIAQVWAKRAEMLEDAAFRGEQMPEGLAYPEQLLFLKFRYLYAYAKLVQMPPGQGKTEKQEILAAYIAHCAEHLIYLQASQEAGNEV